MKKLMIAAVAAASVGGAFAACSYIPPTPQPTAEKAWAYQWKFTGKTTKGVATKCNGVDMVTRSSASLKIQGWSFYCEPVCGDFESAEADEIFWSTKPEKALLDGGITFELGNVIGKKGKDYETAGEAIFKNAYDLVFAGIGKYDSKNARVSSVKGNFAGTAVAPSLKLGKDTDCIAAPTLVSKVWECCGCPTLDADTVAYGKWSVKYNKSNAKKYGEGKLDMAKVLPKWAR